MHTLSVRSSSLHFPVEPYARALPSLVPCWSYTVIHLPVPVPSSPHSPHQPSSAKQLCALSCSPSSLSGSFLLPEHAAARSWILGVWPHSAAGHGQPASLCFIICHPATAHMSPTLAVTQLSFLSAAVARHGRDFVFIGILALQVMNRTIQTCVWGDKLSNLLR